MAQKADRQIKLVEDLGSMFTWVTFFARFFLFSCSKASDANIAPFPGRNRILGNAKNHIKCRFTQIFEGITGSFNMIM